MALGVTISTPKINEYKGAVPHLQVSIRRGAVLCGGEF